MSNSAVLFSILARFYCCYYCYCHKELSFLVFIMVELHQELQRIEEYLPLVTRMLHVVAALIESFDVNEECDQGTVYTDLGLMHTYFPQNTTLVEPQHSCPIPHLLASDDTRPPSGPVVASIRNAAF